MTYLQLDDAALSRAGALCTAREISQQPTSWIRTQNLIARDAESIACFLKPLLARQELRIVLTGAGSSAYIGECLAPPMLRALGRRVEAIATTDLLSGPGLYLQKDVPTLLVSFGRSGNSPESVAVCELADRLLTECHHLTFACNERGSLYERFRNRAGSLAILLPPETHDESFAMTSSFTSMMLAAWLVFCGGNDDASVVINIAAIATGLLHEHNATLKKLASHDYSRVVYLGSNGFKGLAREAALKLLELTDGGVVGTFDSPLGFRHGPKTIITADTLLFLFVSNDPYTRRYDLDLLCELRSDALAGRVVAITAQGGDAVTKGDYLLVQNADRCSDSELLFVYLVCGQLYAFHKALAVGNKPDQPSKSGTVSRVVRGVTIHSPP